MKTKYYTDGYRLARRVPVDGKAPIIDIFNDRRCGMTWVSGHNTGYFCIFGLKDLITHRDKYPLEMLVEGEFSDQDKMFRALANYTALMGCSHVYADCRHEFQSNEIELDQYVRKNHIKHIMLNDASEFDGFHSSYSGFAAARAPMVERGKKALIVIPGAFKVWGNKEGGTRHPGKSRLAKELRSFNPDAAQSNRPWEQYPALNAFNHIVMSYVISPWFKPKRKKVKQRMEGYGG